MEVRFVDTTFRDGSQSLWALGLRAGMIEAIAESMDRAGFEAIDVPVAGLFQKKYVRDHKEDPWDMARMIARTMPNTTKVCMVGAGFHPFEALPPRSIVELFFTHMMEIGALDRGQMTSNTMDQNKNHFPWLIPMLKQLGMKISISISYSISPRHTDEYYAGKTVDALQFEPDFLYLKDQGGLLTPDTIRTLLPIIIENAGGVPVELHSHCTTGLAPLVYLEALKLGVRTLHTALPPLSDGSSQPSVFNVARNARLQGHTVSIDEEVLRPAAARLTEIAKAENMPIGVPLHYDYAQYVHQVPGGVISNLVYQLAELNLQDRLDEVLDECVRVREDLGYPIMITPHSQFVVTQSAINVAKGKRYEVVIDELILFAMGVYGEDSGEPWMDQDLKDKLLSLSRVDELKNLANVERIDMSLKELRQKMNANSLSDEEFLLRYVMKGESEIQAMRDAGPPKQYFTSSQPLVSLISELGKQDGVRFIHLQRGTDSLMLESRA